MSVPPRNLSSTSTALLLLCAPGLSSGAELRGLWEFDNPANPGEATVGRPLVVGSAPTHHTALEDDAAATLHGVLTTAGGTGSFFTAIHDLAPNGGGAYVNQFSILVDLFSPVASRGAWRRARGTVSRRGMSLSPVQIAWCRKVRVHTTGAAGATRARSPAAFR